MHSRLGREGCDATHVLVLVISPYHDDLVHNLCSLRNGWHVFSQDPVLLDAVIVADTHATPHRRLWREDGDSFVMVFPPSWSSA